MRADPLLGKVGGGWALEFSRDFWAPHGTRRINQRSINSYYRTFLYGYPPRSLVSSPFSAFLVVLRSGCFLNAFGTDRVTLTTYIALAVQLLR
jgi:hypothetical protein